MPASTNPGGGAEAEQSKPKLFREKSLEAIESPEPLNDYLRVTSPGVWLVLAAVIAILTGAILWGVFGRINTTATLAVVAADDEVACYIPYDELEQVMSQGTIRVAGTDYDLAINDFNVTIISEDVNPYARVTGGLEVGDVTVKASIDADLTPGVYAGTVVTESLQPISLLLQ